MQISTGSQDLIIRTIDTVVEEGETIIVEAPTYSGVLAYLNTKRFNVVPVDVDKDGMDAEQLEQTLQRLASGGGGGGRVKLLYAIPFGQNPAGMTYSAQRKREIYAIACKHNMLIFEDDPYCDLFFPDADGGQAIPSFQSIDVEGRVIRSDSFSKILSSGMRVGYGDGGDVMCGV